MCSPQPPEGGSGQTSSSNLNKVGAASDGISAIANYFAQNKAFKANQQNALNDYSTTVEALAARGVETQQATAEAVLSNSLDGARQRAEANAFGAGRGLAGSTVRSLIQSAGAAEGRSNTIIQANRDSQLRQLGRERDGARTSTNRTIRSVAKGSPLALAMSLGKSAAQAFMPTG
jgi:hypothetical protein